MHHAPSVSYPVGRCRFEGVVLAGAILTGLMTWACWVLQPHGAQGFGLAMPLLALALIGGHAVRAWWHSPSARLGWNGEAWTWPGGTADPTMAVPLVMLDLQSVVLLRLGPDGPWVWLEHWRQPDRWSDIRRAVYSRAIHAAPRQPSSQHRVDAAS